MSLFPHLDNLTVEDGKVKRVVPKGQLDAALLRMDRLINECSTRITNLTEKKQAAEAKKTELTALKGQLAVEP